MARSYTRGIGSNINEPQLNYGVFILNSKCLQSDWHISFLTLREIFLDDISQHDTEFAACSDTWVRMTINEKNVFMMSTDVPAFHLVLINDACQMSLVVCHDKQELLCSKKHWRNWTIFWGVQNFSGPLN